MNPDQDIENFWLTFKNCITNFFKDPIKNEDLYYLVADCFTPLNI